MTTATSSGQTRQTQANRRARTRGALLEAAARGLSQNGYGNLVLANVAADAGYTRGALYHLFAGKEDLALAVVAWVEETWWEHMAPLLTGDTDPAEALVGIARSHAIYCRRDIARVAMTLRVEFSGQDHPVGRAADAAVSRVVDACADLIKAGRRTGSIPAGPPPRSLALAIVGSVEGLVINLAGHAPHDARLAQRAVTGLLGLPSGSSMRSAPQGDKALSEPGKRNAGQ